MVKTGILKHRMGRGISLPGLCSILLPGIGVRNRAPAARGLLVGLLLLTGACDGFGRPDLAADGYVEGFFGGVAGDEPNAVLVAQDILDAGGSAADAAVAMGFALTVTYPAAITLGGGGVCLVHDRKSARTEALDFIPHAGSDPAGDRPTATPTLTRGLAALHARYGRLNWRRVLAPAENLARDGHRISRAFATRLAHGAGPLSSDPGARQVFMHPDGTPWGEGEKLLQPALSETLNYIRIEGPDALYAGPLAVRVSSGARAAGGSLTMADLRDQQPRWRETIRVFFDDAEMHFAPPPAAAGPVAAQIWAALAQDARFAEGKPEFRAHLLAEVMKRAFARQRTWLQADFSSAIPVAELLDADAITALIEDVDPLHAADTALFAAGPTHSRQVRAATGFVVVDRNGGAVTCALSNFYPFGTGRMAGDTGILLAAAPAAGDSGRNPLSLLPMLMTGGDDLAFVYASAASGGFFALSDSLRLATETLLVGEPLAEAIAEPRLLALDQPHRVYVENGGAEIADGLEAARQPVSMVDRWQGRVAAVHCPNGLSGGAVPGFCSLANDPRGHGLQVSKQTDD